MTRLCKHCGHATEDELCDVCEIERLRKRVAELEEGAIGYIIYTTGPNADAEIRRLARLVSVEMAKKGGAS